MALLDINLAGALDGIETAAQLQDQFDIAVLFLTGYSKYVVAGKIKLSKPYDYLSKPVRKRELQDTIDKVLKSRRTGEDG